MKYVPFALGIIGLATGFCDTEEMPTLADAEPSSPPYAQMPSLRSGCFGNFYASTDMEVGVDSLEINAEGITQVGLASGQVYNIAAGPKLLIDQAIGWEEILVLRFKGSGTWSLTSDLPSVFIGDAGQNSVNTTTHAYRAEATIGGDLPAISDFLFFQPYIGYGVYHYRINLCGFGTTASPNYTLMKLRYYSPKVGLETLLTPSARTYLRLGLGLEFPHAFMRIADIQDSIFNITAKRKLTGRRHGINALIAAGYQVNDFLGLNARVEYYSISASGAFSLFSGDNGNHQRETGRINSTSFTMGAQLNY